MNDIEYLKKYLPKDKLEEGIKLLENNIPVQYIVGNVDFYNINLEVNKDCLIPRNETELLVEILIDKIKNKFSNEINILDIGTGSGCIAISLDKNINAKVEAVDISDKAIQLAKKNNTKNNANVSFILSDIYENLSKKYDVIVSNPPYLGPDDYIMDIVKNNEPHLALYSPNNGMYHYEKILKYSKGYLKEKFILALELGEHPYEVYALAKKYFPHDNIEILKDYQGLKRYLFITR